jgi:hypothetical protein
MENRKHAAIAAAKKYYKEKGHKLKREKNGWWIWIANLDHSIDVFNSGHAERRILDGGCQDNLLISCVL